MLATLNIVTNPFNQSKDRIQKPIQRKVKINTLVNKHKIDLSKPTICYYNGNLVLRKDWNKTAIKDNDVVSFVRVPEGGGGSNPLRLILMIALASFAPYLAGLIGPSLGIAAGTLGSSLLSAGISFLGNTLINALIPPPQPPKAQQQQQAVAPSPTYTLGAQGNTARIGQAIPVLYGRMKVFPDFAAQPYAEFENNEQYLYQLFCVTQGSASIAPNEVYIEDSPISSFGSDFQLEIIQPNTASALFPTDVYNVSELNGQELLGSNTVGPFTANPSFTTVNKLSFDVVLPRGLSYINDDGGYENRSVSFQFTAQPINDAGINSGSLIIFPLETITNATTTPIRKTYKYDVSPGRYSISGNRVGNKDLNQRVSNDLLFASARCYSSVSRMYGDRTLLAVKLKATNSISSQSSRKINVIATRNLPIPTFDTQIGAYLYSNPQQTRSIAWAIADMCRAAYGAGVTEARFNIAQLVALDAVWTARGDTLNCMFDSTQTFWEALSMACRAGRTRPYVQGGMIHFVRDSLLTLPSAMFTGRNMVRNSFKVTYIMTSDDNADAIDVEYFDEVTWKPRVVRAQLDEVTISTKPAKIKAFGITNREQAYREGMTSIASNRYRRKEITFETELEGHIPALGDLIGIQSDIPEWGQNGEVVDASSGSITSSEPFTWTDDVTHFAMLRKANGSAFGPIEVSRGANDNILLFSPSALTFSVYSGFEKEKTHITFGRSGNVVQLARVLSTTPRDALTVQITAINEDARVHSADGTPIPIDTFLYSLPAPKVKPILKDFTLAQSGSGTSPSISVSWQTVAGAGKYLVEKSSDNTNWETVAEITGNSYSFISNTGVLYVRVAAFGGVLGPFITKSLNVGLIPPPANVASGTVVANGQTFDVTWSTVADCDGYFVEVLNLGSVKRSFNTTKTNFAYTLENAVADGGPWRLVSFRIQARKGAVLSTNPLFLNGNNVAPSAPILLINPGSGNISITVSKSNELDYAGTLIYASTVAGFTPAPENLIYEGSANFYLLNTTTTMYVKAAHYDTYGKIGLNFSNEQSSIPTAAGGGIRSVSVLPAQNESIEGDIVYLTTDDLIYNNDGFQWVASGSIVADGSITNVKLATDSISSAKIQAGAITAQKINVANLAAISANIGAITAGSITLDNAGFIRGGQTAYNTGTGFFLGYSDTTYKFSIGSSAQGLTWDGAAMNIKGNITAGTISIGTGFSVSSTGVVTIKSALTGARLEIANDVIRVYDESNVLRVKLGNLA